MASQGVLNGIQEYEDEIRYMSAAELAREFCFASSSNVNVAKLIRNIIWQAFTRIRDGKREKIGSNIRGFWYTDVKPVLSRLGKETQGRRYTERLYDYLLEMVTQHRLFNYADFGFIDETAGMKYIGQSNVHVILFAEKDGLFPIVRAIAEKYDCVGLSTGGYPSILSAEYLVRGISRYTHLRHHFDTLSIVDYDPNGYIIEREFCQQVSLFDMKDMRLWPIIRPDHLTSEQIELCKYSLTDTKKTETWMEETGGIGGEPYGIEANAFTPKQIEEIFLSCVGERLRPVEERKEDDGADRLQQIEERLDRIEDVLEQILEGVSQAAGKEA